MPKKTTTTTIGNKRKAAATPDEKYLDPEYVEKRRRNNDAVNRTREKKRKEDEETATKVAAVQAENEQLERKAEQLNRELKFLKDMFVDLARTKGDAQASSSVVEHNEINNTIRTSSSSCSTAKPIGRQQTSTIGRTPNATIQTTRRTNNSAATYYDTNSLTNNNNQQARPKGAKR